METIQRHRITIEQTGLKYGLILAGANISFFLLMALFGLHNQIWLRFTNLIFIFFIIYKGLQYFKHHSLINQWNYFKGMGLGLYILLIGTIIFSLFITLYGFLDANFVATINKTSGINLTLNPVAVALITFLETMIYGYIIVFTAMQRLKVSHLKEPVNI